MLAGPPVHSCLTQTQGKSGADPVIPLLRHEI